MSTSDKPLDQRRSAPAVERNREPILAVLQRFFPASGKVLELASGTGEHAAYFCAQLSGLTWQPSDVDVQNLQSIEAWRTHTGRDNLLPAVTIDLSHGGVAPEPVYDAAFCANLIHIAPFSVCQHLMQYVGSALKPKGRFVMYGPFKIDGRHTAPSNEAFEQWLWDKSPEYGVRDMSEVVACAARENLTLLERVSMPANNFCLVFEKLAPV